jgi:hypothetical protein
LARVTKNAPACRSMQPGEIDVATIHHVDGAGLGQQHVKRMHIVHLAVGDV